MKLIALASAIMMTSMSAAASATMEPPAAPTQYGYGPQSPLVATTNMSDAERAAFALLEGVMTVAKAKIHATSCSATVGTYPTSIVTNGLLATDMAADNSITVTSLGGAFKLEAKMRNKVAFRGQKVKIQQVGAGQFDGRAVSSLDMNGFYNVANNMLTQNGSVDVVGANGRPDRYKGSLIKDFFRGAIHETKSSGDIDPEFYLIYDWGLEALKKLGYPVNKYWQRSKARRSDGTFGKIVFVQDRLVGATSCRITIALEGDNYADYVLMTGNVSVSTAKPSDPVAELAL